MEKLTKYFLYVKIPQKIKKKVKIKMKENDYSQYRTNAYYECACQYNEIPKEIEIKNKEEEQKDDYLICDVSCNDIDNCW